MVSKLEHTASHISTVRNRLANDKLFQSIGYERFLPRSQAFRNEGRISKAEEIHKFKESVLYEIPPHEHLYMSWWRCASHERLGMKIFRVSTDSDQDIPDSVQQKIKPIPKSNHAQLNDLNLFVRIRSLTIYNIFPDFHPSTCRITTNVVILSLVRPDALISTVV